MATSTSAYQKLLSVGTKIVAVGRNYAAHAKELGNAVPKVSPRSQIASLDTNSQQSPIHRTSISHQSLKNIVPFSNCY